MNCFNCGSLGSYDSVYGYAYCHVCGNLGVRARERINGQVSRENPTYQEYPQKVTETPSQYRKRVAEIKESLRKQDEIYAEIQRKKESEATIDQHVRNIGEIIKENWRRNGKL